LKDGTRGIDSLQNHHPNVLQEIPTRISPYASTAAVVDRHDDDADRQPRPHLLPTQTENNSNHQLLPPQPATDDYMDRTLDKIHQLMRRWPPIAPLLPQLTPSSIVMTDADRQPHNPRPHLFPILTELNSVNPILSPKPVTDNDVDRTLAKINQMMQNWPPITTNHDPSVITRNTPRHPSSLPSPETILVVDEPFDYGSTLDKITAKVEQMSRRWPSTVAPTDPRPHTSAGSAPCKSSSPSPTAPSYPRTLSTTLASKTLLVADCPAPTATYNVVEPPQRDTAIGDDSIDLSLLAAVQSLDNFLIKYPRPINCTDAHDRYQPSTDRRLSLSRHDLLAQQTQVLHTANVILGELCAKMSQFLDALSRSPPSLTTLTLQLRPRTQRAPALPALQLPAKTSRPSQQSIPAKPPFTCPNNKLMLHRTKDHLRPP